uniref:G-protein coupled receptors family 1 profile domain-containing protein n=1 Tax=Acrobeloides nanus TaxID=290746 RepID=A0A914EAI9_9BILA
LIYSTIYAVIFVIGIIGNGLLIGTMVIRKRMTVANVFLINLAVSDLLLCITALPITPVLAFVKRWLFGGMLCKLVPLCQGISVLISSYCLCLIAVDRYRSIVTPLKIPWTVRQAQFMVAACWMGSITVSSPLFITQRLQQIVLGNTTLCGEFCGEYDWPPDPRIKLFYGSGLLVVQYLIPVSIMAFCYWKILQKVRQDWIVDTGSLLTEAQQAQTLIRKRRVYWLLILMVAVFMGSWMPLSVVNILRDMGVGFLDVQMYFKLLNVHALAMTTICTNPLLYFWMSKRHRKALKDDMFWLTNVRKQHQMGLLERFAPNPSVGILYKKSLERHLLHPPKYSYRRPTLADPTCMNRERSVQEMQANCFLLVPLMPLYVPGRSSSNAFLRP